MEKTNQATDSNRLIYEAIRKIAMHKIVNPSTGVIKSTERKTGIVAKIHDDPNDELCGTVDVQEYGYDFVDNKDLQQGYHEGVYISAIQNNEAGAYVMPMLYSDVVIMTDPTTLKEYVILVSHVDIVHLDSHKEISIGVTETKAYDTSSDSTPEFDELEKTGLDAHLKFTKTDITQQVTGKSSSSISKITENNIELTHEKSTINIQKESLKSAVDKSSMEIKSDSEILTSKKILLGDENAKYSAVLGEKLADVLIEFLNYMSQVKTTTQLGPQPPLNLASFISLKAKVQSYKNSVSGFLSKTVKTKE